MAAAARPPDAVHHLVLLPAPACRMNSDTSTASEVESLTENTEDRVEPSRGVLRTVILWPFSLVVRAYRGFWWMLGYPRRSSEAEAEPEPGPAVSTPARQNLSGRKRLHRVTRVMLLVLPRCVQSFLGYPVSSSIGRALSPDIGVSPTKPCGKGSKRKQDQLDEGEDEEGAETQQTWVEALNQELADEDPEEDPDYEPSSVETESEEFRSQNNTESDIEVQGKVVIEDVDTGTETFQAS